ncbi:hypothetical protein HPB49_013767 [Dermacentor silvarum]|uniref:Uncharacterized protein n=1 Tax=Dermacentor silvarum TaxID=543639 RepID=A0ACB8CFK7_DERSI|nr:hypothetical protein HPB49_013767 [Dermacentor silvarum]
MSGNVYREMMQVTNKEQLEVVRDVIDHLTTPTSDPWRIFLTGVAGGGKTFVLRLIRDAYNRYTNTASRCTRNAYVACATTSKAVVAIQIQSACPWRPPQRKPKLLPYSI